MIGGPPGSKAAAAFAQALAAIDDDAAIDDGGEEKTGIAAIAPATGAERPLEGEVIPPPAKKRAGKAKSGVVMERRGRPSTRAQKLVCEQLKHGPKPEASVMAAAANAEISERAVITAADALAFAHGAANGDYRARVNLPLRDEAELGPHSVKMLCPPSRSPER